MESPETRIRSLKQEARTLLLDWEDGHRSTFHFIWLRDNCPQSRHPESDQRWLNPTSLPADIHPESTRIDAEQRLEIVWSHGGHVSRFEPSWLREHCYSEERVPRRPTLWDASLASRLPEAEYQAFSKDTPVLCDWLQRFRAHGFAVLRGVPPRTEGLEAVVERLNGIFWVPWWASRIEDVIVNERDDLFVAFTNEPLFPHCDDAYLDPGPQLTLLHCLVNDAQGGESTLVDGFKLATDLREEAPEKFELLAKHRIRHRNRAEDRDYIKDAPLIQLDARGEIQRIRRSNQSIQPFHLPVDEMERYYDAYCTFFRMAESDAYRLCFRLEPGDLYMVDNCRMLHGRKGFEAGRTRHFQSCYIDRDGPMSLLAVLER